MIQGATMSDLFKIRLGLTLAANDSVPATPENGTIYYDLSEGKFKFREAGAWINLGSGGLSGLTDTYLPVATGPTTIVDSKLKFDTMELIQTEGLPLTIKTTNGAFPTAPLVLNTGNATGITNSSGDIALRTGSAALGNAGRLYIETGVGSISSASININSGNVTSLTSGNTVVATGTATTGNTGALYLNSGNVSSTVGVSGPARLFSGTVTTGSSGDVEVYTGSASSGGTTGHLILKVGTTSGTFGKIQLQPQVPSVAGQVWKATDTSGSGQWAIPSNGINYVGNSEATINIDGWATYADAAAVTPVDGTGGSPNTTLTRNTTTPLRGISDFLITKNTGVARLGEGVSYDFTVSKADLGKVLRISMDYATSASYIDGDIRCYIIYDTAGTPKLIEPSQRDLLANTNGKLITEFQTDASITTYRLVFHIATSSITPWTVNFDNVSVGPREIARGSVVTDWASFTPTGSWTANTTYTGSWRRIGDSAHIHVKIALSGAPTAANLTVNLPSGMTIDTSKLNTGANMSLALASGETLSAGAGHDVAVDYQSTTSVRVLVKNAGGTYLTQPAYVTNLVPATYALNDHITFSYMVPIVGWSANSNISSDFGGRVIALNVTGKPTNTLTGSLTDTLFPTVTKDTVNGYNPSTGEYAVKESGQYIVTSSTRLNNSALAVNDGSNLSILKNGTIMQTNVQLASNTSVLSKMVHGSIILDCVSGDIIKIQCANGGTTPTFDAAGTYHSFNVSKIQSPQTLIGSEFKLPIITKMASGSGTWVWPLGCKYIEVEGCGSGGGGGSSSNASNGVAGANGTQTYFRIGGSDLVYGNGGAGGAGGSTAAGQPAGGAGGTALVPANSGIAIQGGGGNRGWNMVVAQYSPAGMGGMNPFAGAGATVFLGAGAAGATNSGAGGGGGATNGSAQSGGAGGAGGYFKCQLSGYLSGQSFNWLVGASAAGGTLAANNAGGASGSGVLYIKEYY